MGMSVVEFLRRKNEIVKEVTGTIIVPENQIKEIPEDKREPLGYCNVEDISEYKALASKLCPYCLAYLDSNCEGCPMLEAGNYCNEEGGRSTWWVADDLWVEKATEKDWEKLRDLVVEYDKQFGVVK